MTDSELGELDKQLLNALQWDFPVVARPFAALGERLGTSEADILERVERVKASGVLRQLSAIFDTRALGFSSALVAARIDPDQVDAGAARVSEHPGVSHNYKRNHPYNLWYTLAVPPGADFDAHLDVLHRESGATVTRKLPTLVLYKIGVKLDMTGKTAADAKTEVLEHERPERRPEMAAPELTPLEMAVIRVVQEDLPVVERPFAAQAELVGCTEAELLDTLRLPCFATGTPQAAATNAVAVLMLNVRSSSPPVPQVSSTTPGIGSIPSQRLRSARAAAVISESIGIPTHLSLPPCGAWGLSLSHHETPME